MLKNKCVLKNKLKTIRIFKQKISTAYNFNMVKEKKLQEGKKTCASETNILKFK